MCLDAALSVAALVEFLLLAIAACFFLLHAIHLRADFPNHSPWMDWSKYTDEGWYGDAAIRHFQRGTWYVPGDFNPAAALPVWPLVESVIFRFTGVSVVAARALSVGIFGLILVCVYLFVRRWAESRIRISTHSLACAGNRRTAARCKPILLRVQSPRHSGTDAHPAYIAGITCFVLQLSRSDGQSGGAIGCDVQFPWSR